MSLYLYHNRTVNLELQEQGPGSIHAVHSSPLVFFMGESRIKLYYLWYPFYPAPFGQDIFYAGTTPMGVSNIPLNAYLGG